MLNARKKCSVLFSLLFLCHSLSARGQSLTSSTQAVGFESVSNYLVNFVIDDLKEVLCPRKPRLSTFLNKAFESDEFSYEKMFVYGTLAKQAYHSAWANHNLKTSGFDEIVHLKNQKTGFSGYVARTNGHVVVAISGTFSLRDIIQDLKFSTVKDSTGLIPGKVHRGFLEALDSVWPELLELLARPQFQGLKVHLTGHSLGAASATLAAARLSAAGFNVGDVYAFASPRAGDEEFSHWYDLALGDRTYRFTRGLDIIPRVPPDFSDAVQFARLFPPGQFEEVKKLVEDFRYRHVGKAYVFERERDSTFPEWPSIGDFGYWRWLADNISSKNPLSSMMYSRDAALHHIPEAYICYPSQKLTFDL